jgi:phage shock protein PspC (stress-responsive transcriptional regulator)
MTTNQATDLELPAAPSFEEPSWGTAPSTAPSGTGTDQPGNASSGNASSGNPSSGTSPSGPPSGPSSPPAPPAARFFDTIRRGGVVRPDRGHGRMVAGVAAGLARRWNMDPTVVRVAFIALTFIGGLGASLYGLGWLFLPEPDGRIHAQQLLAGRLSVGFVGAVLATLAVTDGAAAPVIAAVAVTLIVLLARNRTASTSPAGTH